MEGKDSMHRNNPPRALGVIPARGGSKRLVRKNIRDLCGKPLIAYTIEAAQKTTLLTNYLVSSEDAEILSIARLYGAPVPFVRPASLATDEVRNIDVMIHALEFMEKKNDILYDLLVLLQPTSPIRDPRHIDMAVELLWKSDLPTLASVKGPFQKRDPVLKRISPETNILVPYRPGIENDREPFYIYNASIYAVKRDYLLKERKHVSQQQVPLVMDAVHSIDVDTEMDLLIAETCLKYLAGKEKAL